MQNLIQEKRSKTLKCLKLIHGYSSSTIDKVLRDMSNVK